MTAPFKTIKVIKQIILSIELERDELQNILIDKIYSELWLELNKISMSQSLIH